MEPVEEKEVQPREEQSQPETGARACPYCGKEMRMGAIPAHQNRLKWLSGSQTDFEREEVWLSEYPLVTGKEARAFYCMDCKMVVLPVPELKSIPDQLEEKWSAAAEKLSAALASRETRREEAKRDKELEKRQKNIKKGKNPWEL